MSIMRRHRLGNAVITPWSRTLDCCVNSITSSDKQTHIYVRAVHRPHRKQRSTARSTRSTTSSASAVPQSLTTTCFIWTAQPGTSCGGEPTRYAEHLTEELPMSIAKSIRAPPSMAFFACDTPSRIACPRFRVTEAATATTTEETESNTSARSSSVCDACELLQSLDRDTPCFK